MKLIKPDSHEHWLQLKSEDISSTESSALFGINPWITKFELWHRKKNKEIVTIQENERMRWGTRLEKAIAYGIAEDREWTIEPFKDYARIDGERIGSSFDFAIVDPHDEMRILSLLEIKNVDSLQFKDKWIIEDGKVIEAPPHIELQAQHQLMVTGLDEMYIGALIGGNSVAVIHRKRSQQIVASLKKEIAKFWQSIDENKPPEPDFIKDAEFISELYSIAEPGKTMDAHADQQIKSLVDEYNKCATLIRETEKKKSAAKAKILTLIGDHERVTSDDYTISASMVGPAQVSYERAGFRRFGIYMKKNKETK